MKGILHSKELYMGMDVNTKQWYFFLRNPPTRLGIFPIYDKSNLFLDIVRETYYVAKREKVNSKVYSTPFSMLEKDERGKETQIKIPYLMYYTKVKPLEFDILYAIDSRGFTVDLEDLYETDKKFFASQLVLSYKNEEHKFPYRIIQFLE
jgi:hypothetical protein